MEKRDISSSISKPKMLRRSLVLLLNVMLWMFVLHFSIHDDDVTALLSYVTVIFTVITVRYSLRGSMNNREFIAFFIDFPSKILIFVGIFLALLLQLWNTAFYSICLGIIIQKVKSEEQVRGEEICPYLSTKIINGKCKPDSIYEFNSRNLNVISHGNNSKVNDLNSVNCCTDVNLNAKSKFLIRNIAEKDIKVEYEKKENQYFTKLNESPSGVYETSGYEEISNEKNFNSAEFSKLENVLDDYSSFLTDNLIDFEPSLNRQTQTIEQNTGSNYDNLQIQRNGRLCTMQIDLLNLKDLELSECAILESKFELSENNIKRELERNEESVDHSMENMSVNDDLQNFLKYEIELENSDNTKKTESGSKIINELYLEQINVSSDIYKNSVDFNHNYLIACENSLRENEEIEIMESDSSEDSVSLLSFNDENISDISCEHKTDTENVIQNVETDSRGEILSGIEKNSEVECASMNFTSMKTAHIQPVKRTDDEFMNLNICLPDEERISEGCDTNYDMNLESNFMKKIESERNCVVNNENFTAVIKYSNVKQKTTNVRLENPCEMKLISRQIADGNLQIIYCDRNGLIFQMEHTIEPECLIKSEILNDSSKTDESTDAEEKIDANEPETNVSGVADEIKFSNDSNVEDVVNRIDLSFIYAVGFDVPYSKYPF